MTVKTLRGLELNPTFEKLVATGESWDFPSDAEYFGRAAINFRNSWFGSQLDPAGSVVDEDHDEQVQKVLAAMKAFADQQDKRREQKREENRNMFAENLPRANNEAEHVRPEASAPRPASAPSASTAPTPTGALGQRGSAPSFLQRMELRQKQHPREVNSFNYKKEINRTRQDARQAADRNRELNHKRQQAVNARNAARTEQFRIDTPPSPPPDPPARMQDKYDQRLLRAKAQRNPRIQMKRAPQDRQAARDEQLQQKRESAAQIARKRARPDRDVPTRMRRRRTQ